MCVCIVDFCIRKRRRDMIFFHTNFKYTYVQVFFVIYVNKISSFNLFDFFFIEFWRKIFYQYFIKYMHNTTATYLIFWIQNYQHVLRNKINCSKKSTFINILLKVIFVKILPKTFKYFFRKICQKWKIIIFFSSTYSVITSIILSDIKTPIRNIVTSGR